MIKLCCFSLGLFILHYIKVFDTIVYILQSVSFFFDTKSNAWKFIKPTIHVVISKQKETETISLIRAHLEMTS